MKTVYFLKKESCYQYKIKFLLKAPKNPKKFSCVWNVQRQFSWSLNNLCSLWSLTCYQWGPMMTQPHIRQGSPISGHYNRVSMSSEPSSWQPGACLGDNSIPTLICQAGLANWRIGQSCAQLVLCLHSDWPIFNVGFLYSMFWTNYACNMEVWKNYFKNISRGGKSKQWLLGVKFLTVS